VRVARPALALLACLVIAGFSCDGAERDSDVPPDPLSKAEYVRRADAICSEYDRRLERLPDPENVEGIADVAEDAIPIAREGARELRALRPPEDLEQTVERWLARNDENIERMQDLRDAARRGDATEVQRIASKAVENERRADALARRIGLRACAREEQP
jgi:hypothetical protein